MLNRTLVAIGTVVLLAGTITATRVARETEQSTSVEKYSRTEEYGPVRLSYGDLQADIQRIRSFIDDANGIREEREWLVESLSLGDELMEVELRDAFTLEGRSDLPDVALDVTYHYQQREGPISSVLLLLGDYSREIRVSGSSREQVDALVALVQRDAKRRSALFGGSSQRIVAALALIALGMFLPLCARIPMHATAQWVLLAFGPMLVVCVMLFPWKAWFPGTAVYADDASWLVRNNPWLTLVGVVLTFVTFAISIGTSVYLSRRAGLAGSPSDARDDRDA